MTRRLAAALPDWLPLSLSLACTARLLQPHTCAMLRAEPSTDLAHSQSVTRARSQHARAEVTPPLRPFLPITVASQPGHLQPRHPVSPRRTAGPPVASTCIPAAVSAASQRVACSSPAVASSCALEHCCSEHGPPPASPAATASMPPPTTKPALAPLAILLSTPLLMMLCECRCARVQPGVQGRAGGGCCTELGMRHEPLVPGATVEAAARSHCSAQSHTATTSSCEQLANAAVCIRHWRSPGPPSRVTVNLANTATRTRVAVRVGPPVGSTGTGEQAGRPGILCLRPRRAQRAQLCSASTWKHYSAPLG